MQRLELMQFHLVKEMQMVKEMQIKFDFVINLILSLVGH